MAQQSPERQAAPDAASLLVPALKFGGFTGTYRISCDFCDFERAGAACSIVHLSTLFVLSKSSSACSYARLYPAFAAYTTKPSSIHPQ